MQHSQQHTCADPKINLVRVENAPTLPANFYISHETDSAAAIGDMLWAVHTAPYNVAFWNPPEELIPSSFRDEFSSLFENNHFLLQNIHILQNRLSEIAHLTGRYSSMRRKFNRLASATGGSAGDLIHEWGRVSVDLIERMADPAIGRFVSVEFQSNGGSLSRTRPSYGFHFDRRSASGFHDIRDGETGRKIRFCDSLRLLWVQAGPTTVFADNANFSLQRNRIVSHRFDAAEIQSYHAAPWTFALLTSSGWSHREILHSTPAHEKGDAPQSRLIWNIDVKHRKIPSFADYQKWHVLHAACEPASA